MLTQRQFSALKARLTRAQRSADPVAVLDACNAAARTFNADGYPDAWHRWNVARQDALRACMERAACGDARCYAAVAANAHDPFTF